LGESEFLKIGHCFGKHAKESLGVSEADHGIRFSFLSHQRGAEIFGKESPGFRRKLESLHIEKGNAFHRIHQEGEKNLPASHEEEPLLRIQRKVGKAEAYAQVHDGNHGASPVDYSPEKGRSVGKRHECRRCGHPFDFLHREGEALGVDRKDQEMPLFRGFHLLSLLSGRAIGEA
jgi:hypothetical protein